jgi:hypothetical protein
MLNVKGEKKREADKKETPKTGGLSKSRRHAMKSINISCDMLFS